MRMTIFWLYKNQLNSLNTLLINVSILPFMKYLLIDNCSLRDLMDIHGFSRYLLQLQELINSNEIRFVTHTNVLIEWAKHRTEWEKEKTRKLLGYNKKDALSSQGLTSLLPSVELLSDEHIKAQRIQINKLLEDAIILDTPQVIKNEFADRYRLGQAPFHNKKNSLNDWEIIGSFCQHADVMGWREIFFISSNTGEFGDLINPSNVIHKDIQERFPKLIINYYSDYTAFFKTIENIDLFPLQLLSYSIIPNERYNFKTTLKKTVLDSLYFFYNELYKEIDFVPLHILKNYYPFASSEDAYSYFSNFTLSNVSENMIQFFANINVVQNKITFKNEALLQPIKNYREKSDSVLRKLTNNLIYHISGEKTKKRICTHYFPEGVCECVRCSFNRFEFSKAISLLDKDNADYKEKLKNAYIHYQFGNYESANKIYEDIIEQAQKDKKYISYFIAKYNQRHLSAFMQNFLHNKNQNKKLIDSLSKIDPLEEAVKLKAGTDYNLLSFIAQEDYFSNAFQGVVQATKQIKDDYQNQLNGGWSHNNFIDELTEQFAKLDSMLNSNFIIYDRYDNFSKLFEHVSEGILASLANSSAEGNHFEKFDDYWLTKFIFYGNRKRIVSFASHYNLSQLEYEPRLKQNDFLVERLGNFIKDKEAIDNQTFMGLEDNNLFFRRRINSLIEMTITMFALVKIDQKNLLKGAQIILSHLKSNRSRKFQYYETLDYFFKKKANLLPAKIKLPFLTELLLDCKAIDSNIIIEIISSYKRNQIISLSPRLLKEIISKAFIPCIKCNQKHSVYPIIFLFSKLNKINKNTVINAVEESLLTKFDFHLFYLSALYEVIPPNPKKIIALIKDFKPPKINHSIRSIFSGQSDFQVHFADEIINLCFKFDIDTTTKQFKIISKIHPYYKWLLNMDQFNYKNFNPEWVLTYKTTYYLKKMAKSEKLIIALRNFLKEKPHERVERLLLEITNFNC